MTPMPLGFFVMKLQPKVCLAEYDILFACFVVEAKSKIIIFIAFLDDSCQAVSKSAEKNLKKSVGPSICIQHFDDYLWFLFLLIS